MREGKAQWMQVTGQGTKNKALEKEKREVVKRPVNTKMGHTVEGEQDSVFCSRSTEATSTEAR